MPSDENALYIISFRAWCLAVRSTRGRLETCTQHYAVLEWRPTRHISTSARFTEVHCSTTRTVSLSNLRPHAKMGKAKNQSPLIGCSGAISNSGDTSFDLKTNCEDTWTTVFIILLALLLYYYYYYYCCTVKLPRTWCCRLVFSEKEREREIEWGRGARTSVNLQCDILPVHKIVPQITNAWLFLRILNVMS